MLNSKSFNIRTGLIQSLITIVLVVGVFWMIAPDFNKAKHSLRQNFLLSHIQKERANVEARAKLVTLNQLMPSFDYLFAYIQNPSGEFEKGRLRGFNGYINYYEKVAAYMPHYAEAHGLLGFLYYQEGDTEKAKGSYLKAITLDQEFFWYPYSLGLILFKEGQYAEALALLNKAVKLNPELTIKKILSSKIYLDILRSGNINQFPWEQRLQEAYRQAYLLMVLSQQHLQGGKPPGLNPDAVHVQVF